jgi:hypothetical protein
VSRVVVLSGCSLADSPLHGELPRGASRAGRHRCARIQSLSPLTVARSARCSRLYNTHAPFRSNHNSFSRVARRFAKTNTAPPCTGSCSPRSRAVCASRSKPRLMSTGSVQTKIRTPPGITPSSRARRGAAREPQPRTSRGSGGACRHSAQLECPTFSRDRPHLDQGYLLGARRLNGVHARCHRGARARQTARSTPRRSYRAAVAGAGRPSAPRRQRAGPLRFGAPHRA